MQEINIAEVFKNIKKHRGEKFAKILREAELLDVPNIEHILEFARMEDLEKLIPIIRSKCKIMSVSRYNTDKNPLDLLHEAGYDAFVVETEKQKNSIKKYYRFGEELCTFRDPERHKNFYMIHAVKRGADKIKPSPTPKREDEYGTSVISIQIAKGGGFISIKNRYNHTVNNPDATFGNNPDNIIPGLTNSLRKFFDVEFNVSMVEMPDDYVWVNDQLVWYDFEQDNIYFGDDYYFTGSTITRLNKAYEIMFDGIIYNAKNKTITSPIKNNPTVTVFAEAFDGKKVTRSYDKTTNRTVLTTSDGNRIVVSGGQIIELSLPNVQEIGDNFLLYNDYLTSINLPNVKKIGDKFLFYNKSLTSINLPNVKKIGESFLEHNRVLTSINLPNVEYIASDFLGNNRAMKSIDLPNVKKIGYYFLASNDVLTSIDLPNVEYIGGHFLEDNHVLKSIDVPNVKEIGDNFLEHNHALKSIDLLNIKEIGDYVLSDNEGLTSINLPNVKRIGDSFLANNEGLTSVNLPNVEYIGDHFLVHNHALKSIDLPNVKEIRESFLLYNKGLTSVNLPNFEYIGWYFLGYNRGALKSINLPKKYDWLVKALLSKNNSKTQRLKNAVKKVLKKIIPETQNETVSDNGR